MSPFLFAGIPYEAHTVSGSHPRRCASSARNTASWRIEIRSTHARKGGKRLVKEQQIREAVSSILDAIGEDVDREGLRETPGRVARMYAEFFSGLSQDPAKELATGFEEGHRDIVVLKGIEFNSICKHHLLPFYGTAQIGYVPCGRVVGASKLARVLDVLARRPQLQERLTNQFVDVVYTTLQPEGVAVILSAKHMCMTMRGVKKPGSEIVTQASRGSLKTQPDVRRDFLAMLQEM
jgi:GTP cyclohydrolase I